jgi:hypothetical protein
VAGSYGDAPIEWLADVAAPVAHPPLPPEAWLPPPAPTRPGLWARVRRHRRLMIATATAVVLAVTGGAYALWPSPGPPKITSDGVMVDHPELVIASADQKFSAYVAAHHGATTNNSRCYFQRAAAGSVRSDVTGSVWCGPVQFANGRPGATYLTFSVSKELSNGLATLAVPKAPVSAVAIALDKTVHLVRPDRRKPDLGSSLRVPPVPAAAADYLATLPASDVPAVTPRYYPRIVGPSADVSLDSSGFVDRVGLGADEQVAPPGHRLFAFGLNLSGGPVFTAGYANTDVRVSVDNATQRRLPLAGVIEIDTQMFAMSVPSAAHTIDLVLTDRGLVQHLSLITGRPGPDAVAVLARKNTQVSLDDRTIDLVVAYTDNQTSQSVTTTAHLAARQADLLYVVSTSTITPSRRDHAFLHLEMCYTDPSAGTGCYGFRGPDLTLTPRGGAPIVGRDLSDGQHAMAVFEVPATFTDGTVRIHGSEPVPGGTISFPGSVDIPVHFPPG